MEGEIMDTTYLIILCLVVGYGLSLGIKNTVVNVVGIVTGGGGVKQSNGGRILDALFYAGIVFLIMKK